MLTCGDAAWPVAFRGQMAYDLKS